MTDAPGEIVWHGYIRRPFKDISGIVTAWSNKCERLLVGEHDPHDEETSTHCHILISNSTVKKEQLQRIQKEFLPGLAKNEHWIMELTIGKKNKPRVPYKTSLLAPYVMKGAAEKFNHKFSDEELEMSREAWVPPMQSASSSNNQPGNVYIISKKSPPKTITRKELLAEMCENFFSMEQSDKDDKHVVVSMCCKVLRKYGFGINLWHVREYYFALMFDEQDKYNETVNKIVHLIKN